MKKSRFGVARKILIFWTLFIGVGAVLGSVMMFVDPSGETMGMAGMLPYFKKLPFADVLFNDLLFSGVALLIVNGISNLSAAMLMFMKKKIGVMLGMIFGITLMLWICIQFYMFPFNFMSTIYFVFGFCQAVTGYAALVFFKQEQFVVNESDYPNVGTNDKLLVVYFSRMGYVKKKAYEEANRTGAVVYEIKATERTEGTAGFWWCGRYGMHRWGMPIEPIDIDLTKFQKVTIFSPIWVFALSAPVREFCKQSVGKIKNVDYVLVHHTNGLYASAADEADKLLGIKRSSLKSVVCREGEYVKELTEENNA